ncbi:type II toxin-antitoxin system PemK/MazF family toxin [Adlercreutzia sp. ZJ138]|uniref:type II toxin-antitoxin system PemK/MazF family toxin n=1 Tax=Adlercreutzia sp. ZJ138 TaxID=2709405 RepID=UPI0013EAF8E9|nr:type II toxin-antitoxin system PemK/MazF family toxin [Adlercreutzia sp. ZJ138]
MIFCKGDIVEFDFSPSACHEPTGRRSALVVSRDKFNISTSMTLVCPITTRANPFPLHLELPAGLETYGVVAVEQLRAFDLDARHPRFVENVDPRGSFMRDVDELIHSFI